jgi:glucan biosynthesis protein
MLAAEVDTGVVRHEVIPAKQVQIGLITVVGSIAKATAVHTREAKVPLIKVGITRIPVHRIITEDTSESIDMSDRRGAIEQTREEAIETWLYEWQPDVQVLAPRQLKMPDLPLLTLKPITTSTPAV